MGKHVKKRKKFKWFILISLILFILLVAALFLTKKIRIAALWANGYEVHGVDVSHYQGKIDWHELAGQDIDFAFIKATEGSTHLDEQFARNWQKAPKEKLMVGAYHFFSFDSPGDSQAEWFIKNVGSLSGKLAPVVDAEFYGKEDKNSPEEEVVRDNLQKMFSRLEKEYHMKPILYTTYSFYRRYIQGHFEGYPLWIRNVYYSPNLDFGSSWTFWQYTDRAELSGYKGEEKYIDKNVFYGNREELKQYICP